MRALREPTLAESMHPWKLTLPRRGAVHTIVGRIVVNAKAIWGVSKRLLKGCHAPAPSNERAAARRPPLDVGDVIVGGVFVIAHAGLAGRYSLHSHTHNEKSACCSCVSPSIWSGSSAKNLTQYERGLQSLVKLNYLDDSSF